VREPLSVVGQLAVVAVPAGPNPAPQSNADRESGRDVGARRVARFVSASAIDVPSFTPGDVKVAVGATLLTVAVVRYSVKPPSLSITLPPTVSVPLSVVGHDAVLDEVGSE